MSTTKEISSIRNIVIAQISVRIKENNIVPITKEGTVNKFYDKPKQKEIG